MSEYSAGDPRAAGARTFINYNLTGPGVALIGIGSGAAVTKDILANATALGNPARVVRSS